MSIVRRETWHVICDICHDEGDDSKATEDEVREWAKGWETYLPDNHCCDRCAEGLGWA